MLANFSQFKNCKLYKTIFVHDLSTNIGYLMRQAFLHYTNLLISSRMHGKQNMFSLNLNSINFWEKCLSLKTKYFVFVARHKLVNNALLKTQKKEHND